MVLLKESFLFLQYFGLWPSLHWQPRAWKTIVYSLYTSYVIFSIYWFTISGSIHLLFIADNVEDFSDSSFMMLSLLALSVKVLITAFKRSEIIEILTALENHPHKPVDGECQLLQDEVNEQIRFCLLCYGGLGEASVCYGSIAPFFQNIPFGRLPYKAWIPYDYSISAIYWYTYCQQLLTVFIAANINIGFDTMIFGFIMQICAQFNILKRRVETLVNEFDEKEIQSVSKINSTLLRTYEECITDCIKCHIEIFRLCKRINSTFSGVIFVQYAVSSIIICVSVILVSQMPVSSPKFPTVFSYILCILVEMFLICAAGNEVILEISSDSIFRIFIYSIYLGDTPFLFLKIIFLSQNLMTAIYNTKWYSLNSRLKKSFGFMMARAHKPVMFVSYHVVVLSLESFCVLLKASYTAYTMLQQFSD